MTDEDQIQGLLDDDLSTPAGILTINGIIVDHMSKLARDWARTANDYFLYGNDFAPAHEAAAKAAGLPSQVREPISFPKFIVTNAAKLPKSKGVK